MRYVLLIGLMALGVMSVGCEEEEDPNGTDPNGCTPATCQSLGVACGQHSDGCGEFIECGECGEELSCVAGQCIDDTPVEGPETVLEAMPEALTNQTDATFEFSCEPEPCTFECSLDDEVEQCSSPHIYTDLPDGEHHFQVRAIDDEDVEGEWVEYFWTIDTAAPQVVGLSGPPNPSGLTTATFEFDCSKEGCSFECALDEEALEPCESGVSIGGITEGLRTFEVVATDAVGNESAPSQWIWTMDPAVPDVIDLQGPADPTNETVATFEFDCSREACNFDCRLDDGDLEACVSGVTYDDMEDGTHVFQVRPTDAEANVGGFVEWVWTVATEPPIVEFVEAPPAETEETEATFDFDCIGIECVEFECALNQGAPEPCIPPHTVSGLAGGEHQFFVYATDAAGNIGEASHSWTVTGGEPGPVPAQGWAAVAPGTRHVCGIIADGELYCWGENDAGQLGLGSLLEDRLEPTRVGDEDDWTEISAGHRHSCGIRADGTLWCWGSRDNGRLGDGAITGIRPEPELIAPQFQWSYVTAGSAHSCAIRSDGTLWCWGSNGDGQVAQGAPTVVTTPRQVGANVDWTHVSADGEARSCGRRANGTLWCWGDGVEESGPVQVGDDDDWAQIDMGLFHECGRKENGEIWCWGDNTFGQIGEYGGDESEQPVPVADDLQWTSVTAGGDHSCAVQSSGAAYCWGDNHFGALGDGTGDDSDEPVPVAGGVSWQIVHAGDDTTCGIRHDGSLWCWGWIGGPPDGQVGDPWSRVPVEVDIP